MLRALRQYFVNNLSRKSFLWKVLEFFQGLLYIKNYLFYYKWNLHKDKSSTREINIEFVSYCNLRCSFCSLDHDKPKVRMTEELLEKFLKNFVEDKRFHHIDVIHLHNAGETLLHPKVEALLELFGKYKAIAQSKGITFPEVSLLTNGIPLKEKRALAILDTHAIDAMRFSMDGGSAQRFEEMRTGAKWEDFHKNISFFVQENNKRGKQVKTHIICVIDGDKKPVTDWMEKEFVDVLNMVDTYEIRTPHDWAGEVDIEGNTIIKDKPHKVGCSMLMQQLVLLPDGNVTVCCADLNSKGVIGNINDSDLYSIYTSERRLDMLRKMYQRRKSEIELCKNCETY